MHKPMEVDVDGWFMADISYRISVPYSKLNRTGQLFFGTEPTDFGW
jgi:hypothetical protein